MVLSLFDVVPLLAFTAIKGPNQKWGGDITYIWTREGWLYRAVILDMHSRRVKALSWFGRVNGSVAKFSRLGKTAGLS